MKKYSAFNWFCLSGALLLLTSCATYTYEHQKPAASPRVASGAVSPIASPVNQTHISAIKNLFASKGISKGYVELDRFGRVILKGEYRNEREVDLGFALSQQIVGPKWVSPVTPENIKCEEWQKRIGLLFLEASEGMPSGARTQPGAAIRNRYAIVVGVGKFQYLDRNNFLRYPASDARDFYEYLINPQEGNFPPNNAIILTDSQATKNNINNALQKIKNLAGPDDLVCVFLSSHGTPPDKDGGVRVVAYDSIPEQVRIWETSVSLKEFIQGIKAERLVIVSDACYSSGIYKDIPGFLPSGGKSLGVSGGEEYYGMTRDYSKKVLGSKDLVFQDRATPGKYQRFQATVSPGSPGQPQTASNQGRNSKGGWGKVLIAASSAEEKSWEGDSIKHGYFTFYFLDALQKKQGALQDSFNYASPLVTQRVREDKEGAIQRPQAMATTHNWNMPIAKKTDR
ncbi:MAG: caspase family protein [Desulfuromonadaceae bacterium]